MTPVTSEARRFLDTKFRTLAARARRLSRLTHGSVGIRPQDLPYAPSRAHFAAANARLGTIDRQVKRRLRALATEAGAPQSNTETLLQQAALVEREVDRARRAFSLFFDVFTQRGTTFAPALAACDTIAADCFQIVRHAAPGLLRGPLLKPVTYLEHGFSPATFRRGVLLRRLLGERNPFPLVRMPFERIQSPWGLGGLILHEIGHNLQAELGIWMETHQALQRRVLVVSRNPWLARIWGRWHREIFADLIAILLGGPASVQSMKDFLAYPASRVLAFRTLGVHPVPFLRILMQTEMLRRMGFPKEARRTARVWAGFYMRHMAQGRAPRLLMATAPHLIRHVVDEVVYQPRRGLAQRALVDVVPFSVNDERAIRRAALEIGRGALPPWLPPRFAPSASRYAFDFRLAEPERISRTVMTELARRGAAAAERPVEAVAARLDAIAAA